MRTVNKFSDEDYLNNSEHIRKYILEILKDISELQLVYMTNNKGNISKVVYRIKYTVSRVLEISYKTINTIVIMKVEFKDISSIEKHFINNGYLEISNFEKENFIIYLWLNILNIKKLLD